MCQLLDFNIRLAALHKQYRSPDQVFTEHGINTINGHVNDDNNNDVCMYCSCLKTSSAAAAATMEKKRCAIVYIYSIIICMDFKIVISSISMLSSLSDSIILFVI